MWKKLVLNCGTDRFFKSCVWTVLVLLGIVNAEAATIALKNKFVKDYKTRVTIETDMLVDRVPEKPHGISNENKSEEGDMHVAGRSPVIGLPFVAELKNARDFDSEVTLLKAYAESGEPMHVVGVWRLWCEHAAGNDFKQGKKVSKPKNTNPNHVFEVHPITELNDGDDPITVIESLKPIDGYHGYPASVAFPKFWHKTCTISRDDDYTYLETSDIGYNHVDFVLECADDTPLVVDDGMFMFARVYDDEDNSLQARKCRMVFVKDSDAYNQAVGMHRGDRMHVLGIPRINLSLVDWRAENAIDYPEALEWTLPFEMIIVAAYEDD